MTYFRRLHIFYSILKRLIKIKHLRIKIGSIIKLIIYTGLIFIALGILINIFVIKISDKYILNQINDFQHSEAVIILGAKVYRNNRISSIVYDRTIKGIQLYKNGIVNKILVTGDHGRKHYDEVNTIKHWLKKHNIPDKDIFLDHAGFSTYDSMYRAKEIFEIKSAIVVTQKFHLNRVLYIAMRKGISVQGYPADMRNYLYMNSYKIREFFARIKDFIYINIIKKKPKFLGEKIPISGSGILTHDKR